MPATYTLLGTASVASAGTTQTLDFTSISQSYDSLEIIGTIQHTTDGAGRIRFNSDSGANYRNNRREANAGTISVYFDAGSGASQYMYPAATNTLTTTHFFKMILLNYKDTTANKVAFVYYGHAKASAGKLVGWGTIRYTGTSAITSIQIGDNSTTLGTQTKLSLYGLVNS